MNPLRSLLDALTPEAGAHAERMRTVGVSLKALRGDMRSLHRDVAAVAARAEAIARQIAQLGKLRDGERDAAARLDDLAVMLRSERVAPHLRAAIERAARHEQPVPRLSIEGLWPSDVYEALAGAIPDPVFFEPADAAAPTLRVPPRLASVPAIAIWTWAAEMVDAVVVPAVRARFADLLPAAVDSTPGRLVHRVAGVTAPVSGAKAWQGWHLAIDLTPLGSGTANTASVAAPPGDVGAGAEYTYEVWFGVRPT